MTSVHSSTFTELEYIFTQISDNPSFTIISFSGKYLYRIWNFSVWL